MPLNDDLGINLTVSCGAQACGGSGANPAQPCKCSPHNTLLPPQKPQVSLAVVMLQLTGEPDDGWEYRAGNAGAARPPPPLPPAHRQTVASPLSLHCAVSTLFYWVTFKDHYLHLANKARLRPVYDSTQPPARPLPALIGTSAACLALTLALSVLATRFHVVTLGEGLRMAALLLVIDASLNAR